MKPTLCIESLFIRQQCVEVYAHGSSLNRNSGSDILSQEDISQQFARQSTEACWNSFHKSQFRGRERDPELLVAQEPAQLQEGRVPHNLG